MRNLRTIVSLVLLSVVILALAACGSSGGTASSDPLSSNKGDNGGKTGPIFGNVSTLTGKTGITLATDVTSVGADNGQVVATAKVVNNGAPVPGISVAFSIVAPLSGPATIESGLTTVVTDSNGLALTRITTGSVNYTTNVIVAATATIGKQTATANATFQIVRGTGVISVASIPVKTETVNAGVQPTVLFQQQIPVLLNDSNGNPRPGAPITMAVYTKSGSSTVTITQQTVTTDSSGGAIFDTTVTLPSPPAGSSSISSIVYKLATADANPVVAYAAAYFSVTSTAGNVSAPAVVLTTDRSAYDANDGSVLATAKVTQNGAGVSGVPVTFERVAGPATVDSTPVTSDSNGTAPIRFSTGTVSSITNVIIKATARVGSSDVSAYATFQLVPDLTPQANSTMTLTPDKTSAGIDSEVVLTAALTTPALARLAQNQTVTFSKVAGDAKYKSATGTLADTVTVTTDSNGKAIATLKVGTTATSSSIILKAAVPVNGVSITAYTTIQVVRQNSMIINFLTSKEPTDPDGTLNHLSVKLPWDTTLLNYGFVQLVPFEVLDENGVPMPNVDVYVSAYSTQGDAVVRVYAPSPIKTDDHGRGIFNISIMLPVPSAPGVDNSDGVVYLARATVNGQNLRSYGGVVATVGREKKP